MLRVGDLEKSQAFYRDVMGMQVTERWVQTLSSFDAAKQQMQPSG